MLHPVLVVGNVADLVRDVTDALDAAGYLVVLAPHPHDSAVVARAVAPGVVVVCLPLSDADGRRVLRVLRRYGEHTPLLAVARRLDDDDRDELLAAGADDAAALLPEADALPTSLRSLWRRRRRRGRAAGRPASLDDELHVGDLAIQPSRRSVLHDGRLVTLTPTELGVLLCLARRAGRVVTRETLLEEVWSGRRRAGRRSVDNRILALRRKLERDPDRPRHVHTVVKFGYRLDPSPCADELERALDRAG